MIVRFLGTGSAIQTASLRTSMLLEPPGGAPLLLDAGPECSSLLRRHGFAPHDLQAVLLTHLHGDHILGLPLLLVEFVIAPKEQPLRIIGPAGAEEVVRSLLRLSYPETDPDRFLGNAKAVFESVEYPTPIAVPPWRVVPVAAAHPPVETYGYRLETSDLSIYVSGDTSLTADVESAVAAADVSIVDVTTIDVPLPSHMNYGDAVSLAARCTAGQSIFAVHRSFAEAPAGAPACLLFPQDGSAYRLERGRAPARFG